MILYFAEYDVFLSTLDLRIFIRHQSAFVGLIAYIYYRFSINSTRISSPHTLRPLSIKMDHSGNPKTSPMPNLNWQFVLFKQLFLHPQINIIHKHTNMTENISAFCREHL